MSRYAKLIKNVIFLILTILISTAEARNPNISNWIKNLSYTAVLEPQGEYWEDQIPNVALSGTALHTLWYGVKHDGSDERFVYRRSLDNGATWGKEQVIARNSDIAGTDISDYDMESQTRLCVNEKTVHIVMTRRHPDGLHYTLEYYRSTDNGATFEGRRALVRGADIWIISHTRIVCNSERVVIAYVYRPNWYASFNVNLLISENAGADFRQAQTLSEPYGRSLTFEDLALSGTDIHVLYRMELAGYQQFQIALASSRDDGHSFQSQLLSTTPAPDGGYYTKATKYLYNSPDLVVDGETVHVLWTQVDNKYYGESGGEATLWYARSQNRGLSFSRRRIYATTSALPIGLETLAAAGDHVYIAMLTNDHILRLRRSSDKGLTFKAVQNLGAIGWWPEIGIDPRDTTGASVFVFWDAPTYRHSSNGGQTFSKELWAFSVFSSASYERSQHRVGHDGALHMTSSAHYYSSSLCGGLCDDDLVYRRVQTVPKPPSGTLKGLRIFTSGQVFEDRADNFQAWARTINFRGAMTLEFWVKDLGGGLTTGTTSGWMPMVHKNQDLSANPVWKPAYSLGTFDYYGKRKILARLMTTTGEQELSAPDDEGLLSLKTWTHLAMTYNPAQLGNNLKLYKDGQLIAESAITGKLSQGSGNLFVGRYGNFIIDEARFWSVARPQTQIKATMNQPLTGKEAGLQAYYNFDDTIMDITGKGNDGLLMYKEGFAVGKY